MKPTYPTLYRELIIKILTEKFSLSKNFINGCFLGTRPSHIGEKVREEYARVEKELQELIARNTQQS